MDDERYVPPPYEQGLPDTSRYSGSESDIVAGASYERIGRRNEFRRRERLLDTLAGGRVLLARLLPYAILIFIAVMAWHYLAPENGIGCRRNSLTASKPPSPAVPYP